MVDLVEKVIDHAAGELDLPIMQQPEQDEVAVPAVHLIKPPARHDIGVGQVEQPMLFERRRRFGRRTGEALNQDPFDLFRGQRRLECGRDGERILPGRDVENAGSPFDPGDFVVPQRRRQIGV